MLAVFALRRAVLVVAAMLPRRPVARTRAALPSVTLVVPACNEAATIERTLAAIARLDYPRDALDVVLVDDCSDDRTGEVLARWAADRPSTRVLHLARRSGKPAAVNAAIAAGRATDLVAVVDADVRPRADYLRRVAGACSEDGVGAAVGFLAPENALASVIARYASVETWVHQLVTSAGKDRLDLNPPALGGAAVFRRGAIEQVGWFGPGLFGDDVRATVALTRAGWRTRFVREAVAETAVVSRADAYWRQHVRWARDLTAAARGQPPVAAGVPLRRRIEAWMLAAGYADRLAFALVAMLAAGGRLSLWVPAAYVALTAIEVACAVVLAGAARHLPRLVPATAALFPLDVLATAVASAADLFRRPRVLPAPERTAD